MLHMPTLPTIANVTHSIITCLFPAYAFLNLKGPHDSTPSHLHSDQIGIPILNKTEQAQMQWTQLCNQIELESHLQILYILL